MPKYKIIKSRFIDEKYIHATPEEPAYIDLPAGTKLDHGLQPWDDAAKAEWEKYSEFKYKQAVDAGDLKQPWAKKPDHPQSAGDYYGKKHVGVVNHGPVAPGPDDDEPQRQLHHLDPSQPSMAPQPLYRKESEMPDSPDTLGNSPSSGPQPTNPFTVSKKPAGAKKNEPQVTDKGVIVPPSNRASDKEPV